MATRAEINAGKRPARAAGGDGDGDGQATAGDGETAVQSSGSAVKSSGSGIKKSGSGIKGSGSAVKKSGSAIKRSSAVQKPIQKGSRLTKEETAIDYDGSGGDDDQDGGDGQPGGGERPELPESTRLLLENDGVPKHDIDTGHVVGLLSAFKKTFGGVLTTSLLSAKQSSSGQLSARGTMSSSTVELIRLAPQLKELDVKLKQISRLVSPVNSRELSAAARLLLSSFRQFCLTVRRYQESNDEALLESIKARGVEAKESAKDLAAKLRMWHEEKNIVRTKLEMRKMKQAQEQAKVTTTSVIKLVDIFRCAKDVANSLNRMASDHALSDPKLVYRAALGRQTLLLRFAALGRNFAARFAYLREQNVLLVEISSAIVLASGRLHSTELSLIERHSEAKEGLSSSLQSALMGVTQMVNQFVMTAVELVQTIKQNKAARQQKNVTVWDEVPLKNPRQIAEATFNQLVRVLIDFKSGGTVKYGKTFFRTYRAICSPEYLQQKLFDCWRVPDVHRASEEDYRLGVLACFKEWLTLCPADFSPSMIEQLIAFDASVPAADGEMSLIAPLLQQLTLDAQATRTLDTADVVKQAMSEQDANNYFDGISERLFAEQLTVVDFAMFKRIQPAECLEACWSKEATRYLAPNLLRAIQHFSFVQQFCISAILAVPSLARRAARLAKFMRIGIQLFQIRNFAGASAIDAAISEQAVKRLKYTFADIPPALLAEWRQVSSQISDQNHYAQLKALMKDSQPPLLPPLGLFISELIQIEDRHKLYTDRGLINMQKCELVATVIQHMQEHQSGDGYNFDRDYLFLSALKSFKMIDPDQLYSVSSEREPRSAQKADLIQ